MSHYKLSEKDLLLIKQSSNWATRSYRKVMSIFDRKYGEATRDVLNRSVEVEEKLQNSWDNFVSSGGAGKTSNDIAAINEFAEVAAVMNSTGFLISKHVLPMLREEGYFLPEDNKKKDSDDINFKKSPKEEAIDENEEEAKPPTVKKRNKNKPAEESLKEDIQLSISEWKDALQSKIAEYATATFPKETEKDTEIKNTLRTQMDALADKAKELTPTVFIDSAKFLLTKLNDFEQSLASRASKELPPGTSEMYHLLIKNAKTIESIVAYKLLAESAYGGIRTPIKEKMLALKQYIPFIKNPYDIFAFRKTCVSVVKKLIKSNQDFLDIIHIAMKSKNNDAKWENIINGFNTFATEYNENKESFVQFYDLLKRKAAQDKMKKSKKDKSKNINNPGLNDFQDYSWTDFPTFSANRFKDIALIKIIDTKK